MKKIVPFKKDIIFKTNLAEITSISLEHTLQIEKHIVQGKFIVSGEYKMSEDSTHTDPFSYDLPFDISMDEHYNLDKANADIDDFYYEIINSNVLSVHIDVLLDHLEEVLVEKKEVVAEKEVDQRIEKEDFMLDNLLEEKERVITVLEEPRCIEDEDILPKKEEERNLVNVTDTVTSLFDQMGTDTETYKSYKVYIVREGDSIETIIQRYSVTLEEMQSYNDLQELKLGDKLIIPCSHA